MFGGKTSGDREECSDFHCNRRFGGMNEHKPDSKLVVSDYNINVDYM